eukprot:510261-Amphidinium_carterae.1
MQHFAESKESNGLRARSTALWKCITSRLELSIAFINGKISSEFGMFGFASKHLVEISSDMLTQQAKPKQQRWGGGGCNGAHLCRQQHLHNSCPQH